MPAVAAATAIKSSAMMTTTVESAVMMSGIIAGICVWRIRVVAVHEPPAAFGR